MVQHGTHEDGQTLDLAFANFDDLYLSLSYIEELVSVTILAIEHALTCQSSIKKN